ncbi:Polyketide synthase-nonribosomal peptide synthetase [Cytospora mali]|uniref:Polyketide synthase-nonribosomal peptide synthetase n=1 Tax=Cytospora mali TaxID=578113 RepID=A0A194VDA0_CYTMA|nr:Polyketide synthase-nonribosomal peptide synthetase [Valsa mali var. pyri (nom. inval.)]
MPSYKNEPIAVIGSGCRFPGDSSRPSKLWELLSDPRDVLRKIDRFRADNWYNKDGHHHGASNVLDSYLLAEDTRVFDAQFFSISASEAEAIDPQQRLLMETVYEALEASGASIESLSGSNTAAYVGVMCDDFSSIVYGDTENVPTYAATGSARSIISNRISYFFNWHGPSMTIDTACSSSLIAVHQAVQVLRNGECPVAIAAGTNLIFGPTMYIAESNLNMLSPTGRSRMWDAGADGYARGEGVGAVVLKTLSAALRDGDHIECLIRETGINQDGRTPGITMPSATAQGMLIADTYARAGLDPLKKEDRCQYFEAHGTGTKAGDPQEAGAIFRAFFPEKAEKTQDGEEDNDVLYVGSIKTVIGHTEGTAGIAGLLKASLAIQNKTIPPNMHFMRLNPDIEPYYGNLKVPVEAIEWPELPDGVPRRASVNSFGFGGANAHAIIESYDPPEEVSVETDLPVAMPFVFSAASERSLIALLNAYLSFLKENPDFDARSLSWTLSKRSAFNFRATFAAPSIEALISTIEARLEECKEKKEPVSTRANAKTSRDILGVFTGQGAQWATMGRDLVTSSFAAEAIIDQLEQSLAELPDAPEWSLKAEILADKETSRIALGEISQPLCTAVQVMVVDMLRAAGIKFSAVVGHSSGEIAAAYASGFLSARDAIRIAFYRGKYTKFAKGPNGQNGAMIAAGTSMEDANELCSLPKLNGRVQLAASNSSASVTISGDEDAVDFVQLIFEDESKFARKLKVDTAYHSSHMKPCSSYYLEALGACGIQINTPAEDACPWYSSVFGGEKVTVEHTELLRNAYWKDNMLQPVLFSQALTAAIKDVGTPGLALEVGPHPALKGPASLVIEEAGGAAVPYFGTLARGKNDATALSSTLGSIWTVLGSSAVDFKSYDGCFVKNATYMVSKELPTYTWDHEKIIWNETRMSKAQRLREHPTHELLGARTIDEAEGEYRWRNYIKPNEMPWLKGHAIQGQTVFPAAGFAVMALEASKTLVAEYEKNVKLVELLNFSIHKALSFMDDHTGVETIYVMSNIKKDEQGVTADFSIHACQNKETGGFTSMASGQIRLTMGEPSLEALPERVEPSIPLLPVDTEFFYKELAKLGYGYTGMFNAITEMKRAAGYASGEMIISRDPDSVSHPWVVHPATLDVAFQSIFAAIGAPGDGRLWTLHVPTLISRIAVNPHACQSNSGVEVAMPFDASLSLSEDGMTGDVDIYSEDANEGKSAVIYVEGLHVTPLTQPTAADDRQTFAETVWDIAQPDGTLGWKEWSLTEEEYDGAALVERMCFFYLNALHRAITPEEREKCDWHQLCVLNWAGYVHDLAAQGKHETCKKEWLNDTWADIEEGFNYWSKIHPHFHTLVFIGERLVPFVRGEVSLLDEFRKDDKLSEFYFGHYGYKEYNMYLGKLVKQISHRHHNMRILEIGAGTGSSTAATFECLKDGFASYTYTDISAAFFEDAKDLFKTHADKMIFKTLDAEKDIKEQGFEEGSYDLIIAGNVIHATSSLETTLKNVRKLLRPGGYLCLLEVTNNKPLRIGFGFCGLPGWWAGRDDGRIYSPLIGQKDWDTVLRKSGFSGVDTATPEEKVFMVPFGVLISQAVDKQMEMIREPMAFSGKTTFTEKLLILGGQKVQTSRLVRSLTAFLTPFFAEIQNVENLLDIDEETINAKPTILSLMELDELLFKDFSLEKFNAIVRLCDHSRNILWVTVGSRGEEPYMNMMVGTGRCLVGEMPSLRLQFLNFDGNDKPNAEVIAEHLLRLQISDAWVKGPVKTYDPLWTLEREISMDNGTMVIPRYLPAIDINTRLNSERRLITRDVSPSETVIEIDSSAASYDLLDFAKTEETDDTVTVQVSKSLLSSVSVAGLGCLYVVAGTTIKSGKKVIALSEKNRSIISVPKTWVVQHEEVDDESILASTAAELLADAILATSPNSRSILAHEPSSAVARALNRRAAATGKKIAFTSVVDSSFPGVKHFHPSIPDRVLASSLPKDASLFVDLAETKESQSVGARIKKYLPLGSTPRTSADFYSARAFVAQVYDTESVSKTLQVASENAQALIKSGNAQIVTESLALSAIPGKDIHHTGLRIVDWKKDESVPVRVLPAENSIQFRKDRTYFMIGLTGEVGLALTRWMVERGARYLALSSRNPKIDQTWLDLVEGEGAVVKTYAMDVTSRDSIRSVVKKIEAEMPPIGGVANGAMILKDSLFANQSHEVFLETLRPKVDGTRFLDEIFTDNDLDFFMCFSSLASVSGNIGQTAYAAANAYMCSLIAGRRQRGLVGSVINMPGIVGLGYLNRDPSKLERLRSVGYANINEWEFYQFFSEAVMAGRPESGRNPEITAGLQQIDVENNDNPPAWINIPRFAWLRLVKPQEQNAAGGKGTVSVRNTLKELTKEEDVYQLLLDGLLMTLYQRLNMAPEEQGITPETTIVELGVDSLLAVDMRSWFTKELDLDMPVLKILGGATVADLVEDAVKRLSPDLIPNVVKSAAAEGSPEEKEKKDEAPDSTSAEGSSEEEKKDEVPAPTPAPEAGADATFRDSSEIDEKKDLGAPASPTPGEDNADGPEDRSDADSWVAVPTPAGPDGQAGESQPAIEKTEAEEEPSSQEGCVQDLPSTAEEAAPAAPDVGEVVEEVVEVVESLLPSSAASEEIPRSESPSSSRDDSNYGVETPETHLSDDESEPEDKKENITQDTETSMTDSEPIKADEAEEVKVEIPETKLVFSRTTKMSYASSRFWFLMRYLEDPTTFNLTCRLQFTGRIREPDADRAIAALGVRHDAFRTAFFSHPDRLNEPTQGVLREEDSPLKLERTRIESEAEVEEATEELMKYNFKLHRGESIRIKLLSLNDTTHFLIFGFHHIAIDGFSFNILLAEINKLYDEQPLPPVTCQFSDFAERQRRDVEEGKMDGEMAFWKGEYPDFPEPLPLFPVSHGTKRQNLTNYNFEPADYELDARLVRQIKMQCKRHKITTFHFFLAVLKVFLFRHLDTDDLVIGIADANRADASVTGTVGFLLNLLPLRFKSTKGEVFKDSVVEARNKAYSALANSKLPFDVLLETLDIPRSASHSPLFQVFMDYRQINAEQPKLLGGEAVGTHSVGRNGYDLVVDVNEVAGSSMHVTFRMQKYLYSKPATELLFNSYMRLVRSFATNFDTKVDQVPLWSDEDIGKAKLLGRGPQLTLEWPDTLSHRIMTMATQHPNDIAVKDGLGTELSYSNMQQRINTISKSLITAGVKQGSRVAVFQEPTVDWVCSLLGIWHAGATYIPMDLRSSLSRLAVVAGAAKPTAILCHEATEQSVPELNCKAKVINVSQLAPSDKTITSKAKLEAEAVVLYTSGSTGVPKGIILRHSAFKNTIYGLTKQYNIGREKVLQQSAYTFDFSLDQILCGLVNGGTVYVVPKESRGDPVEISKIILNEGITYTRATPSEYTSWLSYGADYLKTASQWRFAWGGGEMMTNALRQGIEELHLPGLKLYNSYGPGETITCTKTEIPYEGALTQAPPSEIPVGFPLPNYSVYIVDRNLDPVPIGVTGEIVIGGPSVAKGYLNNEKLSSSKFLPNYFAPAEFAPKDGRMSYRTGDIGRLREDGAVIFQGRISGDTQIKLRGIRIELEDIESSIIQAASGVIHRAVVSVRNEILVGHVEFAPGVDAESEGQFLRNLRYKLSLPLYMIPNVLIPMEHIPLNAHGKTDRRAVAEIPLPTASEDKTTFTLTDTEKALRDLWGEIVPKDVIKLMAIDDMTSFFEVGGNSLLLVKLQMMIRTKFAAALSLVELFENNTLGSMAAKISSAEKLDLTIDWDEETAIDRDLLDNTDISVGPALKASGEGLNILMTGTTGFLGKHILNTLAADSRVAKIHCVAVRDKPTRAAPTGPKFVVHPGDMSEPFLGMDEEEFNQLTEEIDLIVHSGANRSFFDYFQLLKGSNYTSTRSVVCLAAARKIPVHFISSGGVLNLDADESGNNDAITHPATAVQAQPPKDGSEGYVSSKWASEKHLEKAASQLGIPVTIHRVVPAGDGAEPTEAMFEDLVSQFKEITKKIQLLPSQSGWEGAFDLIQVEDLAQRIVSASVDCATTAAPAPTSEATYVHHRCEMRVEMADVLPMVEQSGYKDKYDTLPAHKWIGRAKLEGLRWHIASQDSAVVGDEEAGEMVMVRR